MSESTADRDSETGGGAEIRLTSRFRTAREATLAYHRDFYEEAELGAAGTWLARPHRLVVGILDEISGPVHAYDLGAGIGRHTVALAKALPEGSQVSAVELLPSALERLQENAERAGVVAHIDSVVADLADYRFPRADAGLVVAFSVVEHLDGSGAGRAFLRRCRDATVVAGLNVIAFFADRQEVSSTGVCHPALVEWSATADEIRSVLHETYQGWSILIDRSTPTSVAETRGDQQFRMDATLVQFVARRLT